MKPWVATEKKTGSQSAAIARASRGEQPFTWSAERPEPTMPGSGPVSEALGHRYPPRDFPNPDYEWSEATAETIARAQEELTKYRLKEAMREQAMEAHYRYMRLPRLVRVVWEWIRFN